MTFLIKKLKLNNVVWCFRRSSGTRIQMGRGMLVFPLCWSASTPSHRLAPFSLGVLKKKGINKKPPQKITAALADKQPKAELEPSDMWIKCLNISIKYLVENQQLFHRPVWNNQ